MVKGAFVPALCEDGREEREFEKDLKERLGYVHVCFGHDLQIPRC